MVSSSWNVLLDLSPLVVIGEREVSAALAASRGIGDEAEEVGGVLDREAAVRCSAVCNE